MTNQQHPIIPPHELVKQWVDKAVIIGAPPQFWPDQQIIATLAAKWGADYELEACCEWFQVRINEGWNPCHLEDLRNARRPKPPSLKEQALDELVAAERLYPADWSTIRRALEQLDD